MESRLSGLHGFSGFSDRKFSCSFLLCDSVRSFTSAALFSIHPICHDSYNISTFVILSLGKYSPTESEQPSWMENGTASFPTSWRNFLLIFILSKWLTAAFQTDSSKSSTTKWCRQYSSFPVWLWSLRFFNWSLHSTRLSAFIKIAQVKLTFI